MRAADLTRAARYADARGETALGAWLRSVADPVGQHRATVPSDDERAHAVAVAQQTLGVAP